MSTEQLNSGGAKAIGVGEFAALLKSALTANPKLLHSGFAVAVSGGADSLALTLLAENWARKRGIEFVALTVDHGLRRGSKAEADQVGGWLANRGIKHHVLPWRGKKPQANVQALARQARYALMAKWCSGRGFKTLVLAHHLDDQAETLVLRLLRGSGVDGLAAMAPVSKQAGLTLLRPLLNIPGARLKATCRKFDQDWVEDPSNQNAEISRIRVRRFLEGVAPGDDLTQRLAVTASNMARARSALEWATGNLLQRSVVRNEAGYCLLDTPTFADAPEEIGLRALARIARSIGGKPYPPRFAGLTQLHGALTGGGLGRGRTLGGCRFLTWDDGVLIVRENRDVEQLSVRSGGSAQIWDGRFSVRLGRAKGLSDKGLKVGVLGAVGWSQVKAAGAVAPPDIDFSTIPGPARLTLPALWRGTELIAAPQLGFALNSAGKGFTARFEPVTTLAYT